VKKNSFLPRLESLRGIAALTVLSYHVWGQFSDTPTHGLDTAVFNALRGLSNGTGAVVGFFVISGFVLARSLEVNPNPTRYFRNRFFRLFPAAAAVVATLAALHHWFGIYVMYEGDFSLGNVALNMLIIRTDINAVMWSMKVECFATPLIFLSAWMLHKDRVVLLCVAITILFALSFWGPYVHSLGDASNLAPLYAFVVGAMAHRYGNGIASTMKTRTANVAALLSILVFCVCGIKKQTALLLLVECLSSAILIVLVAWSQVAIFKLLDFKLIRFYGEISYSFYLLHVLGISFALRIMSLAQFPTAEWPVSASAILVTIVSIVLTTPAAYLSRRFIEVPSIALGAMFSRGRTLLVVR
jgi:exopolysaccharide production protein ExoZ